MIALVLPLLVSTFTIQHATTPRGVFGAYQLGEEELVEEARNAGISSIVRQYRWERIEPIQDVFRFNEIDRWVDEVLAPNGIFGMVIIRTGQCWATDTTYDEELGVPLHELASAPPLDYGDYYDFVYTLIDHLEGRVDHFVIENDPVTKFSWYGTAEEYKELTRIAYQAAKDANPSCIVIGNKLPAMAFSHLIARDLVEEGRGEEAIEFWNGYNERRAESFQVDSLDELMSWLDSSWSLWLDGFTRTIMQADQARNLDAIGFNYYLHYDYIDEVNAWIRKEMDENGFALPLLDLEHGVKDERGIVPDTTAAAELVKGYVITQSLGLPSLCWYPFTIDSSGHNFEYLKPMWDYQSQTPLPPYFAMQALSSHITPFHVYDSDVISNYRRFAYRNTIAKRLEVDIVWSDSLSRTLLIPFRRSATRAVITHFMGSSTETVSSTNDTLTIDVDESPKFIKWLFEED